MRKALARVLAERGAELVSVYLDMGSENAKGFSQDTQVGGAREIVGGHLGGLSPAGLVV